MYAPATRRTLARGLATAFLAGPWHLDGLTRRGRAALSPPPRWVRSVAREVLELHHRPPLDAPRGLAALIDVLLERRLSRAAPTVPRIVRQPAVASRMGRARWPVPPFDGVGDLADWLGMDAGRLEWLADPRGLERRAPREALRNYRYTWVPRSGGRVRVIEQPKRDLKAAQRRVLDEILVWIPVHDAAHGFVRGRSVRTHAAAHVGARAVIRMDVEDFFASVRVGRVFGVLRLAGYPEGVAHLLAALGSNAVPVDEWAAVPRPRPADRLDPRALGAHHRLGRRLAAPHLPQGAPTSPALANLCTFSLDRRLAGLAARFDARYTRYADDLAFSGGPGLLRGAEALRRAVTAVAADEGFRVNERKSQLMPSAGRQSLCGIVVNERPNVPRGEYDALKAILHNAAHRGPAAENRADHPDFRAHLLGRISWVESLNPARGAKLRERWAAIDWE